MNSKVGIGRRAGLLVVSLLIFYPGSAQSRIGEWRPHLPYQFTNCVMVGGDKAFCSSTGGLFYFEMTDNTVHPLSKADGLSDNGLRTMAWNGDLQLAVLAYENANLDIIRGNEIINIPDILKKPIPGDKTIYHIYFLGNKAYLSCGFGIVVLDLERYEISETYYIGEEGDPLRINQITSDDTWIYAATDEGVKKADRGNAFLMDFKSWQLISDLPDPYGRYTGVANFKGRLFVVNSEPGETRDRVYINTGTWNEFLGLPDTTCNELREAEDYLIFTGSQGVRIMNDDFIFTRSYLEGRPRSATIDESGILWIADYGRGLIRVEGSESRELRPNGPFSDVAFEMTESEGILYTVAGGVSTTYNNTFRSAILQRYRDQFWNSSISTEYLDLISVVVDPGDPLHVFAASWGYGLLEYRDNHLVNVYDNSNSSLQTVPGYSVVRVGGLAYDDEGNLWMSNSGAAKPISVMKSDSTWKNFGVDGLLSSFPALSKILITGEGHLWGIVAKGGGLFAINTNGTLDNEEDDEYKMVNVIDENGRIITNEVFSFAEDRNGNIWLGTDQGILVLYSPGRLFTDGSIYAQEIIVPRNDGTNYGDPLLQTQKVTTIEVDGANRKWIGTADGGAFLVSANGLEQIYDFNTGNSPILSNSITDICVDSKTGEVFFGTEKGIISFRGEATAGAADFSDVKVFPNPVREDYYGPIAISGLMAETTVKITDISGNLVRELKSFGGQAIWDGSNFKGDRVATGIYLVFLVDRDVTSAFVAKILFIH